MATWYICWLFGIFSLVLVSITEKNLATLLPNGAERGAKSNKRKKNWDSIQSFFTSVIYVSRNGHRKFFYLLIVPADQSKL
jgi:hypothetical protein